MGVVIKPNTFVNGTIADATQVNEDFDTVYNEFNGNIDDANIKSTASINGSKVASAPNGVGSSQINDQAVATSKIADGAVTTPKLADGSVTSAKLSAISIGTAQIQDNAITNAKMADLSVGTAELIDANVTAAKLANASVKASNLIPQDTAEFTAATLAAGTSILIDTGLVKANTCPLFPYVTFNSVPTNPVSVTMDDSGGGSNWFIRVANNGASIATIRAKVRYI